MPHQSYGTEVILNDTDKTSNVKYFLRNRKVQRERRLHRTIRRVALPQRRHLTILIQKPLRTKEEGAAIHIIQKATQESGQYLLCCG